MVARAVLALVPTLAVAAFLAGVLAFAVLALAAAVVPVIAFLAVSLRLEEVAFLAGAATFFAGAFLVASAFFAGVAFAFAVVAFVVALAAAAFLVVVDLGAALEVDAFSFATDFFAGFAAFTSGLLAGLALEAAGFATFESGLFSLADVSAVRGFLGANLTRPDRPFGRAKTFFSAPLLIALLSWVVWAAPISIL